MRAPGTLSGPVRFGRNFDKKVRKHIHQIRWRFGHLEPIPEPGNGGIQMVAQIIEARVELATGNDTRFADEPAVAFEDGGVTYIFKPDGEFWTILGN